MTDHTQAVQRAREVLDAIARRIGFDTPYWREEADKLASDVIAMDKELAESHQLFETQNLCLAAVEEREKQKAGRVAELKSQLATARKLIGEINTLHSDIGELGEPTWNERADQFLEETEGRR